MPVAVFDCIHVQEQYGLGTIAMTLCSYVLVMDLHSISWHGVCVCVCVCVCMWCVWCVCVCVCVCVVVCGGWVWVVGVGVGVGVGVWVCACVGVGVGVLYRNTVYLWCLFGMGLSLCSYFLSVSQLVATSLIIGPILWW